MSRSNATVPLTGAPASGVSQANPYINALVTGEKWGDPWTANPSAPTAISYAFVDEQSSAGEATEWYGFEKAALSKALGLWASVANLNFVEVRSKGFYDQTYVEEKTGVSGLDSADLNFDKLSDVEMNLLMGEDGILAFQGGPIGEATYLIAADGEVRHGFGGYNGESRIWNSDSLKQGGRGFATLLHETGHALGLAHPHDRGGKSGLFPGIDTSDDAALEPDQQPAAFDLNQGVWTTMTYRHGRVSDGVDDAGITKYGFEGTPMALDIAAIQHIYGANMTHATGGDVYKLPVADGPGTFYSCIWDAAGTDAIVYEGGTRACVIDLRDAPLVGPDAGGYISQVEGVAGGFTIANGVVIEKAVSGYGNDVLIGNAAGNVLVAGAGTDSIAAGDGGDLVYGNVGADLVYGNPGDDTIYGGQNADRAWGGQGADVVYGNRADDIVYGNLGNDVLFGGDGADQLFGGQADDMLWGNRGDDTMTGGLGADRFLFGLQSGRDVVTDFSAAQGDSIVLEAGMAWTVSEAADGALLSLGEGNEVLLKGIAAASVVEGWITLV